MEVRTMHLERFVTGKEPFYDRAIALCEANFDALERRDAKEQQRVLQHDCYYCCAVMDPDFIGIAFFWETDSFLYLEHLCIDESLRKHGYGAKVLELLKGRGKRIILEIEPAVDAVTRKRKLFYEHNGFVKNDYYHIQPKYRVGDEDLLLWIMTSNGEIDQAEYDEFHAFLQENVEIAL